MSTEKLDPNAIEKLDPEGDWTIPQYSAHKGWSIATFYNLEKRGLTPDVERYPGAA